jgi:hypothetical protein
MDRSIIFVFFCSTDISYEKKEEDNLKEKNKILKLNKS